MTYIIDFDRTLFDTDAWKESLGKFVQPLGIPGHVFAESYTQCMTDGMGVASYSLERHARFLANLTSVPEELLMSALKRGLETAREFVYPDALRFLNHAKSGLHTIILLTLGDPDHQLKKVKATGLDLFFTHMIFTQQDKSKIASLPSHDPQGAWVIINDNPRETIALLKRFPQAHAFLLIRPENKSSSVIKIPELPKSVKIVQSFDECVKV